jgi:anti-sigma B factor antagonist
MISGIQVERSPDGVSLVVLTGEHDLSTAPELTAAIEGAIGDSRGVVIDLDHAEFIDSAVLRVLIVGQQSAEAAGVGYAIALADSTGHAVRRLLELTGLDRKLNMATGRESAVALVLAS